MFNKIYQAASDMKEKVANQVEYQKILKEATSNENWNISNSKL
jgi:hypothetical protein